MQIRLANLQDAEAIAENNIRLARETENFLLTIEKSLEYVKTLLQANKKGFYLVACKQGEIIGQLMITYEYSDWRGHDIWWLQSIYVKDEQRKKGVMSQLIDYIKQMAEQANVRLLRLYVHTTNQGAIDAYTSIDFKQAPYLIFQQALD